MPRQLKLPLKNVVTVKRLTANDKNVARVSEILTETRMQKPWFDEEKEGAAAAAARRAGFRRGYPPKVRRWLGNRNQKVLGVYVDGVLAGAGFVYSVRACDNSLKNFFLDRLKKEGIPVTCTRYLGRLGVHPDFQNRRLGRLLNQSALKTLLKDGVRAAFVTTSEDSITRPWLDEIGERIGEGEVKGTRQIAYFIDFPKKAWRF